MDDEIPHFTLKAMDFQHFTADARDVIFLDSNKIESRPRGHKFLVHGQSKLPALIFCRIPRRDQGTGLLCPSHQNHPPKSLVYRGFLVPLSLR